MNLDALFDGTLAGILEGDPPTRSEFVLWPPPREARSPRVTVCPADPCTPLDCPTFVPDPDETLPILDDLVDDTDPDTLPAWLNS